MASASTPRQPSSRRSSRLSPTARGQARPPMARAPSAVGGASLLILLQLLARLLSLAANQLLLRLLTAPQLGLAAQLDVYHVSVLFLARESLRVAVQRAAPPRAAQAVVNLGFLAVPLGAAAAAALARAYLASAPEATRAAPLLAPALRVYAAAALVELLAEPCFVLMQARRRLGPRAAAESAAALLRCLVLFASASWAARRGVDLGVLPFALAQLAYGLCVLAVYLVAARRLAAEEGFSLVPTPVAPAGNDADADADARSFLFSYFYRPTVRLAGSLMAQSLVKHLLTQGDTLLVSVLSSPEAQGVYALANNYGGLVARLLFQPVEESCRSYFAHLLSSPAAADPKPSPAVGEARQSLGVVVRLYVLLSAVAVGIGPFAAPALVALVAGRRWTGVGAGPALAAYCFYIPFLALNGLSESFVASVASEADVHRQSLWMGAFSVAFAAAAFVLMRVLALGAQGLVLANIVNMACRIVWSTLFIRAFFRRHGAHFAIRPLLPGAAMAASLATFVLLRQLGVLETAESEPVATLAKTAGSAVPLVLTIVYVERTFLLECFHSIRGRNAKQQ